MHGRHAWQGIEHGPCEGRLATWWLTHGAQIKKCTESRSESGSLGFGLGLFGMLGSLVLDPLELGFFGGDPNVVLMVRWLVTITP